MNKILLSLAFVFSSNSAFASPKAPICKAKAENMAIAFFQVNYPEDRLLSVKSDLTQMNHSIGSSDEGLGSETWNVNLEVSFEESSSEGQLAPIEVKLSIDGTDCNVSHVSMPTAG